MTPAQPQQVQLPYAPTPPPVFASDPIGKRPGAKGMNTTFLGAAASPGAGPSPGKSLLGQ